MPLALPPGHPAADRLGRGAERGDGTLRVGIINVMPRAELYEPLLLARLAATPAVVEPVFIRLQSHLYKSSNRAHLDRYYRTYEHAGPLDRLILTGAPVEELPFDAVRYWPELTAVLSHARAHVPSTLGICWGGLALGAVLGIPKRAFPRKLFGVFQEELLQRDALLPPGRHLSCAQSRHSGADESALLAAERAGVLDRLTSSPDTGTGIFATTDRRFVAHLGHPEYEVDRLLFEWDRDRRAGRTDVHAPTGVVLDHPVTTWRSDSDAFFARWLDPSAQRLVANAR